MREEYESEIFRFQLEAQQNYLKYDQQAIKHILFQKSRFQINHLSIGAYRIVIGRCVWPSGCKRIAFVQIDRVAITFDFPIGRNRAASRVTRPGGGS